MRLKSIKIFRFYYRAFKGSAIKLEFKKASATFILIPELTSVISGNLIK